MGDNNPPELNDDSQRLPASLRLKSSVDFAQVMRRGKHAADQTLVIHAIYAPRDGIQIGITIPKKTGNAPARNRWKRLIREAFRLQRTQLPDDIWFVVRPRKGANPDLDSISSSMRRLLRRLQRKL